MGRTALRNSRLGALVTVAAVAACVDAASLQEPATSSDGGATGAPDGGADAPTSGDSGMVERDSGSSRTTDANDASDASDASTAWLLYRYDVVGGTWTAPTPLAQYFGASANAPPATGVSAVTEFSAFDRLLVFAEDGTFYLRSSGVWQTPRKASDVFSTLASAVPRSGYHTPLGDGGTSYEGLTLVDNPKAYLFTYTANDVVTANGAPVTMSDEPQGPPQATGHVDWDFEIYDTSRYLVSGDWAFITFGYGNDVYRLDGAGAWTHWTTATYPYFAGKANAPPPARIRGAFYDAAARAVLMIVAP